MKLVVLAAVGLLVGLLGGTGVAAFKVKGQLLEAAQAVADSTAAAAEADNAGNAGDDGVAPSEGATSADSVTAQGADGSVKVAARGASDSTSAKAAPGTPGDTAAAPVADSATAASTDTAQATRPVSTEGARKLAKIFSAMKPADAAKVLSKMSDDEVKAILLYMDPRQAGQVVGSFEPGRAATLSRIVLQGQPAAAAGGS